ncbi:raffinose/stachyose/melibiose transport system substrate-binding protein [Paenibacillus shirakamiensis]|uniref:Raffinose/stachyose/melibiose transport system substrate-binding protein n=1 Tax=Paenibacillus shirakamiensis TaxID=1265935 RepID=A0ABS4JKK1_9BACL|nr:ABC transporter substrate-binding protein [Paenibacillus shirakamiensis]MBP2002235.1 raffinose/stachyose/melibiose transport system substrate-binding protein [Paenibacillus shirakamiensis]
MKKYSKLALVSVLALSVVLAGCGKKDDTSTEGNKDTASGGTKTIKIFQFKVEIAEALNKLKTDYEAEHPGIKLDIQTVGGGSDYGAALKAKFAGNDEPDIFNVGGYRDLDTWFNNLEDLSAESWVSDVTDVAKEPMTKDGKLYGQPMNVEGYGFIYNKDLFTKAGITETPKTLSQLEDAAKKLQAAGITPFENGYMEGWVLGNHNLNVAFAHQDDPNAFVKGLNDGTAKINGNPVFENWIKLLDLTVKYGQKNPLTTDYNTEVTAFANGEAAMTQQGNWTQVQIDGIKKDLNIGFLPMPIDEDAAKNDKLLVGVPNNWVVNKNSAVKPEAKEFLKWLVTSEKGKKYITDEFKFIPAFKSIEASDTIGPLGKEIQAYSKAGKTLSWEFNKFPDGAFNEFGSQMQAYVAGKSDKAKLFDGLQQTWDSLKTAK